MAAYNHVSSRDVKLGSVTVPCVEAGWKATLNGTTVTGAVDAGNDVRATAVVAKSINASWSATLRQCVIEGAIHAGNDLTMNDSLASRASASWKVTVTGGTFVSITAGNDLRATNTTARTVHAAWKATLSGSTITESSGAGNDFYASDCPRLGKVAVNWSATLTDCPDVMSVSAGEKLQLTRCNIAGDASAKQGARVSDCKIGGELSYASERADFSDIEVQCIRVERCAAPAVMTGASIVVSGGYSVASVGGITVVGDSLGGSRIYVGGQEVSPRASSSASAEEKPQQLVLRGRCRVQRIIFEGGRGTVRASADTVITEGVTGGTLIGGRAGGTPLSSTVPSAAAVIPSELTIEAVQEDPTPPAATTAATFAKVTSAAATVVTEKVDDDDDDGCCIICLDAKVEVMAYPCKHMQFCLDCLSQVSDCPTCRQPITERIKPFK